MDDREMLMLAAKVAGRDFKVGKDWHDEGVIYVDGRDWNPLADDGDAFRLAVRLGLYLEIDRPNTRASALPEDDNMEFKRENFNGDPYKATRRAIVRAAAEIGKVMANG